MRAVGILATVAVAASSTGCGLAAARLLRTTGSLLDLSVGGALLSRNGIPFRIGGYTLLVVGSIELLAQLIEAFPQPSLDRPATVLWRDRRIDLVPSDLAGQDLRDRSAISVSKIVDRRERSAPSQAAKQ